MYDSMIDDEEELGREEEKIRRRQKLVRRFESDVEEDTPRRQGRLKPFDKRSRKFDWKTAVEEAEDGTDRD